MLASQDVSAAEAVEEEEVFLRSPSRAVHVGLAEALDEGNR